MQGELDDDTRMIIASFVAEGYERLDDAEKRLGTLGGNADEETLHAVFRLFHSVKGSAGFLEFGAVIALCHEAESLLDAFLKEGIPWRPESVDLFYETVDLLRSMIRGIGTDGNDTAFAGPAAAQQEKLRSFAEGIRGRPTRDQAGGPVADDTALPRGAHAAPMGAAAPPPAPATIALNEFITSDMAERFLAEIADMVDTAEKDCLELGAQGNRPETLNSLFRTIHTIKGNAGFFGCGTLQNRCMALESILDDARKGAVSVDDNLVTAVLHGLDEIRETLRSTAIVPSGAGADGPAGAESTPVPGYKPIGEILLELGAVNPEAVQSALETQEAPLGEILVRQGRASHDDVDRALEIQKKLAGPEHDEGERREVRVDTVKLDRLFDLVGELITAEAIVLNSPDLAGLSLPAFKKSFAALNKISREIQETTMMVRMIPLEGLFTRMNRLVRDLSRKSGKPVEFRISGKETEMDKNVIEEISDPLVHILRNAVDHGIESPEARRAAGKGETGVVTLDARYEGSEIWVSVTDDGAGLDRERILAKGIETGLVHGDGSTLPDGEVWKLIFEPGFSTNEKVTEISGRGVGMDVVKQNMAKIRGCVSIRTKKCEGTEFILKIPLTMAIIDAITVRAGRNHYSIPVADIVEFFQPDLARVVRLEGDGEVIRLRNEIIPLLRLRTVFGIAGDGNGEGIVVVLSVNGKKAGLLIDEVVDNQQIVIKSLSRYLGTVNGISGCSIMGDGSVSFIIDTARLISLRLGQAETVRR